MPEALLRGIRPALLPLGLSLSLVALLVALGAWWLYLISGFGQALLESGQTEQARDLARMVRWEGGAFLATHSLLVAALVFFHLRDRGKARSLGAFYTGMTHELKTPLAAIRLQAEALRDLERADPRRRGEVVGRIVEGCAKLETLMDKILQLGRIEGGATSDSPTSTSSPSCGRRGSAGPPGWSSPSRTTPKGRGSGGTSSPSAWSSETSSRTP